MVFKIFRIVWTCDSVEIHFIQNDAFNFVMIHTFIDRCKLLEGLSNCRIIYRFVIA